jgi:hypothetical protein
LNATPDKARHSVTVRREVDAGPDVIHMQVSAIYEVADQEDTPEGGDASSRRSQLNAGSKMAALPRPQASSDGGRAERRIRPNHHLAVAPPACATPIALATSPAAPRDHDQMIDFAARRSEAGRRRTGGRWVLSVADGRADCRWITRFLQLLPAVGMARCDPLQLAAAGYLAQFTGLSRTHAESDLRAYLSWCAELCRSIWPAGRRRSSCTCAACGRYVG